LNAASWFEELSFEDKIGQLIVPRPRDKELPPDEYIRRFGAGGVIVHRGIYENPRQMADYIRQLHVAALVRNGVPPFVCCDHEGGHIRFMRSGATAVPSNMALGAAHDPHIAAEAAELLGDELLAVGVNWTLAPVLDVNNNPRNPVIGTRAFSDDPSVVSAYGREAIQAYQKKGLLACAKHFPGHGDTDIDSHIGLPTIKHDRERLDNVELAPFRAAVEAGVGSVMTAHLLVPALDDEWIGTLSAPILTDLLRGEIGHHGVIVTDALEMRGVADLLAEPAAAVESVRAGADVLLTGRDPSGNDEVFKALTSAVRSGRIPAARFEQAVRNILEAKTRFFGDRPPPDPERAAQIVGGAANQQRALDLARRTITVARAEPDVLPLPTGLGQRLVVLNPLGSRRTMMETWTSGQSVLGDEIRRRAPGATELQLEFPLAESVRGEVADVVERAVVVVVGLLNAIVDPDQVALMESIARTAPQATLIGVGLRTPYDLIVLPWLQTYLCAYTSVEPSAIALVEVLFGEQPARGRLPVQLQESQRDPK
jgi:beta-N-acetylhexosaminidase